MQERSGEEDHQAPLTEEVDEFGKIDLQSYIQSQMHFDDSAESTADSDLADGVLRKMLTSPLYAQKATEKPDAMVMQETERGKCTTYPIRPKGKLEVSFI